VSTAPTAATAAAFTAFLAVRLTFKPVTEPERFFVFVTFFRLVLPRFDVLATARLDDDFAVRFFAFFMLPPKNRGPFPWDDLPIQLVTITGSFFVCSNDDDQATDQEKRLFAAVPRLSASSPALPF
jgi:hypothetical protein